MNNLQRISQFVAETDYSRLPPEVTAATRRTLLDTLGVALAGREEEAAEIACRVAEANAGRPSSTILGSGVRTTAADAAWVNGVLAHILDYDDVGHHAQGHVSALLFPVVLALAEELGSSGEEVVTAYALGVEIWARIAATMPLLHHKGWHPTSVFGTIGASVASARLLGLDSTAVANAISIAASSSAGLVQNFGTFTKSLHVGNAARNGIVAALLAREGFTGSHEILAGGGFPQAFFHGQPVDDAAMVADLGERFAIVNPGVYVKRYPCCGILQRIIDAAIHLAKVHDLDPDQIEAVDCELPPLAPRILFYTEPADSLQAKFSLQHAVAAALIDRKVGLAQLSDERVHAPDIRALGPRIRLLVHPGADINDKGDGTPDTATVRMKDGRQFTHCVLRARGHAEEPLDWDELVEKFQDTAGRVLDSRAIARTVDLVAGIERQRDVRELMRGLAKPAAPSESGKSPRGGVEQVSFNAEMLDLRAADNEARLVGSECKACGRVHFPRQARCSDCFSEQPLEDRSLATRGRLYAFTTVERESLAPKGFTVPYAYGYVDLPEGVRLVARITDWTTEALRLDAPVEMVVRPIRKDASGADVMGFCFRPVAADAAGGKQ